MSRRPKAHENGDIAVAAVRQIWARAGAAVQELGKDYGEDLLVLTALAGELDHSRIWVQVKGRSRVPRMDQPDGKATVYVDSELVRRWAMSADPVVFVLWDLQKEVGWYTFPALRYFSDPVDVTSREKVSLRVHAADVFDEHAARSIAGVQRISLLADLMGLQPQGGDGGEVGDVDSAAGPSDDTRIAVDPAVTREVIDLMIKLGILTQGRWDGVRRPLLVSREFRESAVWAISNGVPYESGNMRSYFYSAAIAAILILAEKVPGSALPLPIIGVMADVLETMLIADRPEYGYSRPPLTDVMDGGMVSYLSSSNRLSVSESIADRVKSGPSLEEILNAFETEGEVEKPEPDQ